MSSVESAADDALPLAASQVAAKPSYITWTALAHEGVGLPDWPACSGTR